MSQTKSGIHRLLALLTLFGAALLLGGCGYNGLQSKDEDVKAAWSEVVNQYQRRADLVPNLVNTVKGYATHEEKVLTEVTNARARVGSIQATPELVNDQEAMNKFIAAQRSMTGALSRLMVVSENYPNIKADASFRDLAAQLEGTENRITVARNRYIDAVREYNVQVRSFPGNLTAKMFGMKTKANFSVENEQEISTAPKVDFGPPPAAPAAPTGSAAPSAPAAGGKSP
ncbi:MAG: LemA family protein [Fibrobacteres bacterium]|nr:LemA family protein [Fibrobacterota bacterium]